MRIQEKGESQSREKFLDTLSRTFRNQARQRRGKGRDTGRVTQEMRTGNRGQNLPRQLTAIDQRGTVSQYIGNFQFQLVVLAQ